MGVLDELLRDGRGSLAEGKREEIFERRLSDAKDVQPAVVIEALVLHGHKGGRKMRGEFVPGDALPGRLDLIARAVQKPHRGFAQMQFFGLQPCPRRREHGKQHKGGKDYEERRPQNEQQFSNPFHFPQYVLFCKKIAGEERHGLKKSAFCAIIPN